MGKFFKVVFVILISQVTGFSQTNENKSQNWSELSVRYELSQNSNYGHNFFLIIKNNGNDNLSNTSWAIYFNYATCRKIDPESVQEVIHLEHISGDFYRISPTPSFPILQPGDSISLSFAGSGEIRHFTDIPGGFFIVFKDHSGYIPKNIPFSINSFVEKSEQKINELNKKRFVQNTKLPFLTPEDLPPLIPTPKFYRYEGKFVKLNPEFKIHYESGLRKEAEFLAERLNVYFNKRINVIEDTLTGKNIIALKSSKGLSPSAEYYKLIVERDLGIQISGTSNAGVFYGIQSLLALFPVSAFEKTQSKIPVKGIKVEDEPLFAYRGFMLDVARNYHSLKSVKKLINVLSFYKINTLVLHLSDDEGWRLEIPGLPELTEAGSRRCFSNNKKDCLNPSYGCGYDGSLTNANGYYSKESFIEILKYAGRRHIRVIPEIDVPGHARAAIHAMEIRYDNFLKRGDTLKAEEYLLTDPDDSSEYLSVQLYSDNVVCPCIEGPYNFVKKVANEIAGMYREAGVNLEYINWGGDEVPRGVWAAAPSCKKFISGFDKGNDFSGEIKRKFFERCTKMLDSIGIKTGLYEDGVKNGNQLNKDLNEFGVRIYNWNNVWGWGNEDAGYKIANAGFPVIMANSTNLYFDLAYNRDAAEPGQFWAGYVDSRKIYEFTPFDIYKCAYHDIYGNPLSDNIFESKEKLSVIGFDNIAGIQGMLWTETVRNDSLLEYFLLPKLIALAERSWAQEPAWSRINNQNERLKLLNADWGIFANKLGQTELKRLDFFSGGFSYRIPSPGCIIEDGIFKANVAYPGLTIRYTTNGEEPTLFSTEYTEPVKVNGNVKTAAFTKNGRIGRVVTCFY